MKRSSSYYRSYQPLLSVELNRNYRVKVNDRLVGYSGLCLSLGFEKANYYIEKCRRIRNSQKKRFRDASTSLVVTFYLK